MLGRSRHLGNRAIGAVIQRMCASCASGGPGCEHCAEEEEPRLQRSADGVSSAVSAPSGVPSSVRAELSAPGTALPLDTRLVMQERFGHDFAGVRVHTGSRAAASAKDVGALAYTVGSHVVFGHGQYDPDSPRGRHLLSHELAHVVQQRNARVDLDRLAIDGSTTSPAEREATAVADRVALGRDASVVGNARDATVQRKMVNDEAAGGCGICHNPETAGDYVHRLIQSRFQIDYILKVMDPATKGADYQGPVKFIELPLSQLGAAAGDENKRLDLARVENDEIYIGEIKPANSKRVAEGTNQLRTYAKAIEKALGRKPHGMTDEIDMSDVYMPNPQIKDCPRVQKIFLNKPTEEGLYTYYCQPTRKELWADRTCRCWAPRRKKEEAKRQPEDISVPQAEPGAKSKELREPRAGDQPVQEPEAPVRPPVEEPVRETPQEKPTEKPQTKPGDGDGIPIPPIFVEPGGPGTQDKPKPPKWSPRGDEQPANDNEEVKEKEKQIAAMVALAAALAVAAKTLPKSFFKRVLAPAYAAALLAACAKGGEITFGKGEDPIAWLMKNAEKQGVQIPDDLKDAIDKDPALKKLLTEAAEGGPAALTEAEAKIAQQIARTITENRDKFTDAELEALGEVSKASTGAIRELTVEEIKKTIIERKSGTSATPSPFTKPEEEGPTVTAGELTIEGEAPAPPPKEEPAEDLEIPPDLKDRLKKHKPTERLFQGLLSREKGVKPSKQLVEEFAAIAESANLDDNAVTELLKLLESSEGKTRAEALETIRQAIAKRASPPGPPSPQGPPTPGQPNEPAPAPTGGDSPQPSVESGKPISAPPAPTTTPALSQVPAPILKELKSEKFIERNGKLQAGSTRVSLNPRGPITKGMRVHARLVGRLQAKEGGNLFLGSGTVTFGDSLGDMVWTVTITDLTLYTTSGPVPNPRVGITTLDASEWEASRARRERSKNRKKRR
jgi:hypothetical protein